MTFSRSPPEVFVPHDHHRDAIASRGTPADRAVTDVDAGRFAANLPTNGTTVAGAPNHDARFHSSMTGGSAT